MEVKEPPKRIKTQKKLDPEEKEDRISLLPDSLIIEEILSRLEYTKDAIKTGTLSKRWQHLWPSVPVLSFYDYNYLKVYTSSWSFGEEPLPDFYSSVDKTLAQCQCKNLTKFCMHTNYDARFQSRVNNWIHFATTNKVKQLHLELNFREDADRFVFEDDSFFMSSFFVNPHFTHLHLEHSFLNPVGPISWNNLTHLTISDVRLYDESVENILSGSPLLNTFKLYHCYGFSWLNITSKSVKNLVLRGYHDPDDIISDLDDVIGINAPYISSLEILGTFLLWKILLLDVSSLVKAELDYTKLGHDETTRKIEREEMLKSFILCLRHVQEVKIGTYCYTAFSRLKAKGFDFPSNLKVVNIDYPIYDTEDSTEIGASSDNDSSLGDTAGSVLVTQQA